MCGIDTKTKYVEVLEIDEIGTDILVASFGEKKEHQQCKTHNASNDY